MGDRGLTNETANQYFSLKKFGQPTFLQSGFIYYYPLCLRFGMSLVYFNFCWLIGFLVKLMSRRYLHRIPRIDLFLLSHQALSSAVFPQLDLHYQKLRREHRHDFTIQSLEQSLRRKRTELWMASDTSYICRHTIYNNTVD